MNRLRRWFPLLAASLVAMWALPASHRFWSADACRDNGGRANWDLALCDLGTGQWAPLDPPASVYEGLFVVGMAALPCILAFAIARWSVRQRFPRGAV